MSGAVIESQTASSVLMIRPVRFGSNPLTAPSNAFQAQEVAPSVDLQTPALAEFEALCVALREAGVNVIAIDDTDEPHTPDAIFPNNWITTHADGRVVLYPMEAENRRTERRADIVAALSGEHGFIVTEVLDLSTHEENAHYLEGTGSLVLDRANRVAYACLSSRTHLDPLGDFAQQLDYEVIAFDAADRSGTPIYHTNVLMSVGDSLAIICTEAIVDDAQRAAVMTRLRDDGHDIVDLSFEQLEAFAGNMLQLRNVSNENVMAMSTRAWKSLSKGQQQILEANSRIVHSPIDTIENSSGGSVRCMLAEIHLPH